ncbi:MAG: T9SS type A sorting domain-containing protein [Bacteroidales bacterium]|nr:T9SS type A sorting domain-containing protein [Bacteroidales bacterium]
MRNLFTILFCLFALALGAQPLTLKYENATLPNNATIYVQPTIGVTTNTYVEFFNNTQEDVYFRVRKQVLTDADPSSITFCVGGTCYTGNTSQELFLDAESFWDLTDEANVFHASFSPQNDATQRVRFTIVNADDASDTICFTINYTPTTGVQEFASVSKLSAYPNPATSSVTLEYSLDNVSNAYVVIRNLTGMEVYRGVASGSGKSVVDLTGVKAGIYFYGIESDGRMLSSKKLLVK